MEALAKAALVDSIRSRYYEARKKDKSRILDEFVAITGHQRKNALRLLAAKQEANTAPPTIHGRKIYAGAVKEVLVTLWESSDRLCGKRLKAILPEQLRSMESHGQMNLDESLNELVLSASAATIDRLLRPVRASDGKNASPTQEENSFGNCREDIFGMGGRCTRKPGDRFCCTLRRQSIRRVHT